MSNTKKSSALEKQESKPGALWDFDTVREARLNAEDAPKQEDYYKIVVAIDPAGKRIGGKIGIIVAGSKMDKMDKMVCYVLEDATGLYADKWISEVERVYAHWNATVLVVETNFGGDLSLSALENGWKGDSVAWNAVTVETVNARQGKSARAEPIALQYKNLLVKHVTRQRDGKDFEDLESQMLTYTGKAGEPSPDNMDAMVYAVTYLMENRSFFNVQGLSEWN